MSRPTNLLFSLLFLVFFVACQEESEVATPIQDQNELLPEPATAADINSWMAEAAAEARQNPESRRALGPVRVVDYVDVNRYVGRWYELANFPDFFSQGCTCTTAEYAPIEGGVSVFNNCIVNGGNNSIRGQALVVDPTTNAKLAVQFPVSPFPGEYWIIDLAENGQDKPYTFAVVSNSDRSSLFILSRTPQITTFRQKFELTRIFINLILQGFDLRELAITPQPGDCEYPM